MKIHESLYPHIEVSQVISLDNAFRDKDGVLSLVELNDDGTYQAEYRGTDNLSPKEQNELSRILIGWGKIRRGVLREKAEVKLGSNSKLKNCQDKALIHLVPLNVIQEVAIVYTSNFAQYGEDWKGLPNAKDIFYDAMMRHLIAWHSGEKVDPDDGKLHIIKVVANAIFLAWHELKDSVCPKA